MRKPSLSFWQIWNMCFGFFGIQIAFALQNANVSRIFQTLGANVEDIAILWIAAPLTGLLVQPVIGYMSDRTWGRLGRRRPYFFWGALATTAALFFMPNAPALWFAAGMLWILDASINVTMEPFRAFVGDMLPHRQRTKGFAMQTFFIGLGGTLASFMPWILTEFFQVANTAPEGEIPPSVTLSFYIGAAVLFAAVMWTVFSTKEYSPDELAAFDDAEPATGTTGAGAMEAEAPARRYLSWGGAMLLIGGVGTIIVAQLSTGADVALSINDLYFVSIGLVALGLLLLTAGLLKQRGRTQNPYSEVMNDLFTMPKTMRQLAVVQFFSWFAFFAFWIYTVPGVSNFHYGATDTTSEAYNNAANWVGVLSGLQFAFAALAAFVIPVLASAFSRKATHAICLLCGGAGLASFLVIGAPQLLWISMIGVGIAWASVLSVPYAILSGALPSSKMGVYMGIFNFFIVIPQLLAASILGVLVQYAFGGEAIYALAAGGVSLALAAAATMLVHDPAGASLGEEGGQPVMAGGH